MANKSQKDLKIFAKIPFEKRTSELAKTSPASTLSEIKYTGKVIS